MKRRFPLDVVLRVRQAREKVARAEVAQANANLTEATDRVTRREASLLERTLPDGAPVAAFLGAVTSTRSMATEVAALQELSRQRRVELATAKENWTAAEQAHSAVEQLAERHRITVQHELQGTEQRELDELAQHPQQISDWVTGTGGEQS